MRVIFSAASEDVLKRLAKAGDVFEEAARAYLTKAGLMVEGRARELAPSDKGTLRGSIKAGKVKKEWGEFSIKIGTNVSYAPYHEFGTGIYGKFNRPIRPKRARVLAWKSGGGWVFAKSVRGVKASKYLENGVFYMQKNSALAFSEADKIIQGKL